MTPELREITDRLDQLTRTEMLWLIESVARRLRGGAIPGQREFDRAITEMAADPQIQSALSGVDAAELTGVADLEAAS